MTEDKKPLNIYQKLFEVKKVWIKLQRDTQAYSYKYATLSQIQDKLSEVLEEHLLLVTHQVDYDKVTTSIINIENPKEFMQSSIPLTESTKPQDKGSEITYYRRYNLLSLLDLEVEDDDWAKAQWSKKEDDKELPWITKEIIDKVVEKNEKENLSLSIKDIREKYKVSKANAELLKSLWIN